MAPGVPVVLHGLQVRPPLVVEEVEGHRVVVVAAEAVLSLAVAAAVEVLALPERTVVRCGLGCRCLVQGCGVQRIVSALD